MVTAQDVNNRPKMWLPERAANFPDNWRYISKHRHPNLPMPVSMILAIFFEETGCCNTIQTPPYAIGPGQIQIADFWPKHFVAGQNPNGEKKENGLGKRWDSSQTTWAVDTFTSKRIMNPRPVRNGLPPLLQEEIFKSYEFGVKLHVKLFEWNWRGYGNGVPLPTTNALLGMQLAGQTASFKAKARAAFFQASKRIDALVKEKPPLQFRPDGSLPQEFYATRRRLFANALNDVRSQIKGNPIDYKTFGKFWEFFLPDDFLTDPMGYILLGY